VILEIDAGNTSLKWRWRGSAASSVSSLRQLESAIADARRPDEVLVCNVRGEEFEAELTAWFADRWELRPRFAAVARVCGGVRIQYPDPSRLGADRWLAMLAGFRIAGGSCLVVDGGTALTIDMLDAGGLHLGGYIMPGLEMSRAALTRDTSIRLAPGGAAESAAPGNDTAAAVRNGTLFMLCSAVRAALKRRERQNESPPVILTGGDAAVLGAFLQEEIGRDGILTVPDLVLDGLALTCPDERNENCATS